MHFNVQDKYFKLISEGKKTAEGRIYKPKLHYLKPGDIITFSPNSDATSILHGKVKYVNVYADFKDMLEAGELEHLLPDVHEIQKGVSIYEKFGSYKEDQFTYGVASIGFSLAK